MRSAPPLQVSVNHYGLLRGASALLAASACAAMLAWWSAQPTPIPPWASGAAAIGVLVSLACVAGLWRTPPLTLRWDRQRWLVARDGSVEQGGELAVMLDLGGWMLLRLRPERASAGAAPRGVPVWIWLQRRGLEAQWHALRCTVYAARQASRSGDGDA